MRDQVEFVELVDRYKIGQAQRLSIGLFARADFAEVHGALLLSRGRGKWLRPQWVEQKRFPVPPAIASACSKLAESAQFDAADFFRLRSDFTRVLAEAALQLSSLSGKASKKLTSACVSDPGVWPEDFDGTQCYDSFCDPALLAELSGLTIIDALPQRDLASGGRGGPLEPLANWFLYADRDERVAKITRCLVSLGDATEVTLLPASDGLDSELPRVRYRALPGLRFLERLCEITGLDIKSEELSADSRLGAVSEPFVSLWQTLEQDREASHWRPRLDWSDQLATDVGRLAERPDFRVRDVLTTFYWLVARSSSDVAKRYTHATGQLQVIFTGQCQAHRRLVEAFEDQGFAVDGSVSKTIGLDPELASATALAVLGLMHIDQTPVSLPWLTGCDLPRVLGRLTPGSPSNWRQAIMEMADYRPPMMKLREAV